MPDWKIQKKEEACSACDRAFGEGESFFSVLLVSPEALGREDRCPPCFEALEASEDAVFWRTRRPSAKKRGLAVDFESIERLFLALDGRPEERLVELRYLLSLLLLRKKRLKLVRIRRTEDQELMLLRRPRRQEEIEVRVFDLTPERTTALRAELERIFEGAGAADLELAPTAGADEGSVGEGTESV